MKQHAKIGNKRRILEENAQKDLRDSLRSVSIANLRKALKQWQTEDHGNGSGLDR